MSRARLDENEPQRGTNVDPAPDRPAGRIGTRTTRARRGPGLPANDAHPVPRQAGRSTGSSIHDRQAGPRGRHADSPGDIPSKGWLDILYRSFKEVSNDRLTLVAAGITFYLLLALAPTLAAFVSIYGLFFDPASVQDHLAALAGVLPGGAMDILDTQLDRLASAGTQALGFAFALSLGLALWSANAGMKALFQGMNVAYDEVEERGFVKLTLVTLAFTVSTLAAVIGLIAFNLAFSTFADLTGLSALPDWAVTAITGTIALAGLVFFMAALYRWAPSRETPRWEWTTPGAVFAGLAIILVSVGFSFYVSNFGTYNETYGSLGAVVGFLTWLWLTVCVLLVGGEINSEMEHQTTRDTTTGPEQPMGRRGAVMADNVGPSWREKKDGDGGAEPANFQANRSSAGQDGARGGGEARASAPRSMGLYEHRATPAGRAPSRKDSALTAAVVLGAVGLAVARSTARGRRAGPPSDGRGQR